MRLNENNSDPSIATTNSSSINSEDPNNDLLSKSNSKLVIAKRENGQEPKSSKKLKTESVSVLKIWIRN